ncbi:AAA family ATPase [Halolamina litorea]|uniref:Archaea-specific SMC-related protein n=1 Tax=Halolamina litorea TaxID=1515593 RepID=A0ABD6BQ50_9EURY|nr:archaea-specific SMC-related protein [Halolamina litorea]
MTVQEPVAEHARLSVRNVGGIDETEVEFSPGVTVLEGRNATNRTSLLQSIMAACGSERVSIKGDADSASVTLDLGNEQYERTLERRDGEVHNRGDEAIDDPELATQFAFLLESNEARRAVARGDDLREIIMRPVDTDDIRREISEAEQRRREIDDRIEELTDRAEDLPDLRERRDAVDEQIGETEERLADLESEIDEAALEAEREEQRAIEQRLSTLRGLRDDLEDVRYDAETERESLERLREERAELREERESLPTDEDDADSIDRELAARRERRSSLEAKLGELDTVIQFNSERLEGSREGVREALDGEGGDPTNRLLENGTVACWTCGSAVEPTEIERTLSLLEELRARTADERDEVVAEIDRLEAERSSIEQRRRRREEIDRRLDRIAEEIDAAESTLEALTTRREELEAEIERTEEDVDRLREESETELLDLHEEADELERELGRLTADRDSLAEEIDAAEAAAEEHEAVADERERLTERLVDLRTRIDRVQTEAVEGFNERMETVLDLLDYDNIDRVWIERTGTGDDSTFDLHVVRSSAAGAAYEDTVAHLSESEREVVGLVFALAGYLTHDVHERCPFVLLDSLEAIDADRIAALVDYFADYGQFLVVALLPGDAAALDDSYDRITDI